MERSFYIITISLLIAGCLNAQIERGSRWIMGYDPSSLDTIGEVLQFNFNESPVNISLINSVDNFFMEGSNTSMCDTEGNLLFYSNGCLIVNAAGEIMQNGDGINPGFLQNYFCSSGGSPIIQGVIAIPSPGNENHYYVFNLDFDIAFPDDTSQLEIAPLRVYYQEIDILEDGGLGGVIAKNKIAVQDTFSRVNLQAVRHANNRDWWIVMPKSHSNCYFLTLVTPDGVQPPFLKCAGTEWTSDDSGGQAVFSPDLSKYIRFNEWNGLNIFDFDNATGDLSNQTRIMFPNDTIGYFAGVAVSSNSRFLYACARKRVYQFDLEAADIEASKILIAEWDGTFNPYATIFYLSALAPDGKIYISSTSSHLSLHVIEEPNNPGLDCRLIQNGVTLPSYNFATIPNIPHYCRSEEECEVTVNNDNEIIETNVISIFPNPTSDLLQLHLPGAFDGKKYHWQLTDALGRVLLEENFLSGELERKSVASLATGIYFWQLYGDGILVDTGKVVRN